MYNRYTGKMSTVRSCSLKFIDRSKERMCCPEHEFDEVDVSDNGGYILYYLMACHPSPVKRFIRFVFWEILVCMFCCKSRRVIYTPRDVYHDDCILESSASDFTCF